MIILVFNSIRYNLWRYVFVFIQYFLLCKESGNIVIIVEVYIFVGLLFFCFFIIVDEWLDDNLMKEIEVNDIFFKKLGDKKYVDVVNQFQLDLVQVMERYKDDKEIQEFFIVFCKIMGIFF